MRIAIVTDAWSPQINGVVTTMRATVDCLRSRDCDVRVIEPSLFRTLPCPGYREIRLAVDTGRVAELLRTWWPDRVHVVTEGPLGRAAVRFLQRAGWAYTTAFHTRFPEYLRARLPLVPLSWGYGVLRRFHAASSAVLVPTPGMAAELTQRGFTNLKTWSRGVDTDLFTPDAATGTCRCRPVFLYVGRVAPEKNIRAFLGLSLPGTKIVVGDGPARDRLQREWPQVTFAGYRRGRELAAAYADADVLVFPSRTDTYGVVMLEAMACGTPVAAYPVHGPLDVVREGVNGCLDDDLEAAALRALRLDRSACRACALEHDWWATAGDFLDMLVDTGVARVKRPA